MLPTFQPLSGNSLNSLPAPYCFDRLSKQYGAGRLLSEFPNNGWKVGSMDSLLKRITRRIQFSGNQESFDSFAVNILVLWH